MALGAAHRNWRSDVRALVEYIESWWWYSHDLGDWTYTVANTYFNHPNVWPSLSPHDLGYVSVDFWGPGGRDDTIDYSLGNRIIRYIWYETGPVPPWVRYYIWQRNMYGVRLDRVGTGEYWWEPYGDPFDPTDDVHERHVHFTFWDQGGL